MFVECQTLVEDTQHLHVLSRLNYFQLCLIDLSSLEMISVYTKTAWGGW